MQIIYKPKQTLLPFSLRKKFFTEQSSSTIQETYRMTKSRKNKLKLKLKKLQEYKRPKFLSYHLDGIDQTTRKKMKSMLNQNIRVLRSKKNSPVLLSDFFIQYLSENLKGVSYSSATYMAIIPYINDIFEGILGVPENHNILMAIGQISRNYYLFFDNCFEIPYSYCCNQEIYLKLQVVKYLPRVFSLRRNQNHQNPGQIKSIKTQLICRQCKGQIIHFYGQQTLGESDCNSIQKTKRSIQQQTQRRKFSIGMMVGSGKFKNFRINTSHRQQSSLSKNFNPESIFITNSLIKKTKTSREETEHKTVALSQQPKSLRNDFYPIDQ